MERRVFAALHPHIGEMTSLCKAGAIRQAEELITDKTGYMWAAVRLDILGVGLFVASAAVAERYWSELFTALRSVRIEQTMTTPVIPRPNR